MATLIDSYSETNADVQQAVRATPFQNQEIGQCFTAISSTLDSASFYLAKVGAPTGSIRAKLYATTGTFGSTMVPTGTALATSDDIDISSLTTSFALLSFTFSGANNVTLLEGTHYAITVESLVGDASNYLNAKYDNSSPTHSGNKIQFGFSNQTWGATSSGDLPFYVYGVSTPVASVDHIRITVAYTEPIPGSLSNITSISNIQTLTL